MIGHFNIIWWLSSLQISKYSYLWTYICVLLHIHWPFLQQHHIWREWYISVQNIFLIREELKLSLTEYLCIFFLDLIVSRGSHHFCILWYPEKKFYWEEKSITCILFIWKVFTLVFVSTVFRVEMIIREQFILCDS